LISLDKWRITTLKNLFDSMAKFKTTLIIDDAVDSGASINQIACKLHYWQFE